MSRPYKALCGFVSCAAVLAFVADYRATTARTEARAALPVGFGGSMKRANLAAIHLAERAADSLMELRADVHHNARRIASLEGETLPGPFDLDVWIDAQAKTRDGWLTLTHAQRLAWCYRQPFAPGHVWPADELLRGEIQANARKAQARRITSMAEEWNTAKGFRHQGWILMSTGKAK